MGRTRGRDTASCSESPRPSHRSTIIRQDASGRHPDKRAPDLVSAVLRYGALERGETQIVLKTSERTARNTLSKLTSASYLSSASPKSPVLLAFPLDYPERVFPNLFADADLPE